MLCLGTLAADNYMYFLVDSLKMNWSSENSRLEGIASAQKLYVMMADNEFEIQTQDNELFQATTYLARNRFTFVKDGMKFSTSIGDTNPILSLKKLDASKAEVELASTGIKVVGDWLDASLRGIGFSVTDFNMVCPTDSFTTDVDTACVKQTLIQTENPEGYSDLRLYDDSGKKEFDIGIKAKEVSIADERLNIESDNIEGFFKGANFGLKNAKVDCFKNPNLIDLDVEGFLLGCLAESDIRGSGLRFVSSGLNAYINNASLEFKDNFFRVISDDAQFHSGKEKTIVAGMILECDKDPIDQKSFSNNPVINGCMRKMRLSFERIEGHKEVSRAMFDINNSEFRLTGKLKFLLRLRILATGSIKHNSLTNQLTVTINKARVSGISARKLAISLIKKFIDSDRIQIRGSSIVIQL